MPTHWLAQCEVWAALLDSDMPLTAMIRNLATMTRVGLLTPMSEAAAKVTAELINRDRLVAARVHPIALLSALITYQSGSGVRGWGKWKPVAEVVAGSLPEMTAPPWEAALPQPMTTLPREEWPTIVSSPPPAAVDNAADARATPAPARFCNNCGLGLAADATICPDCGSQDIS